jgi:hypothetical protein
MFINYSSFKLIHKTSDQILILSGHTTKNTIEGPAWKFSGGQALSLLRKLIAFETRQ